LAWQLSSGYSDVSEQAEFGRMTSKLSDRKTDVEKP